VIQGAPTIQIKQTLDTLTDPELTERWSTLKNPEVRKAITEIMMTRGIWPSASMKARDQAAGLYPDPDDPSFAARLFEKREFYESRALIAQVANGTIDPCTSAAANAVFELTPVQRLVSRFMHPLTPYLGLLLFHGVGVGKTCSAVTIAEQFLEASPNKVIVLVPQAIQENFKKTVFDPSKLSWSGSSWTTNQCTGVSYLERLGLLTTKDLKAVAYAVEADRRKRYTVTGYQAFANWIQRSLANHVPAGLEGEARLLAENEVLRKLFSDHLIIVDEAHNLRDVTDDETVVAADAGENAGGKALNPFLKRIVLNAEGLRLVFMTATPMYNSAPEILRLLNFLIMNDTKREDSALQTADIFGPSGELKDGSPLESAARRYVSYMRGENPFTFPLRMRPAEATEVAAQWPTVSATKTPIVLTDFDRAALDVLPLVFTEPVAGSKVEEALRGATVRGSLPENEGGEGGGGRDVMLDLRMQMANITYPNNMYGTEGWNTFFKPVEARTATRKVRTFAPKEDLSVFESGLEAHAPKIKRIVDSIISASGICFAYSRYIKAGALPLAVALERAGFQRRLADGSVLPLLAGVPPVAPICAVCSRTQAGHRGGPQGGATMQGEAPETHPFSPAYYILLTSEDEISPDFPGLVRMATTWKDPVWGPMGTSVKAIIGSQVASEGLDLKCVREMHILDSWYHLNRTDQIIGRAIRYCSHSALRVTEQEMGVAPMAYNNCLIYLHAAIVRDSATGPGFETADMYAYRLAIRKARNIGIVQRLLKKHAWDCNLEMEAIVFTGLPPRIQIDAQDRELPEYSANDQDYTTYCDYQVCKHECAVAVGEGGGGDDSTYRVADARRGIIAKMDIVRHLFDDQVMVPESMIQEIFADLPWEIRSEALLELIDGKRFKIRRGHTDGYLIKKAGFVIFQPILVQDTEIPMALRYDRAFQLTRKFMTITKPVFSKLEDVVVLDEEGPVPTTSALTGWNDWLTFVNGGPLPSNIPTTQRIWTWLRNHFSVPETRGVALRWFFDKVCSHADQKNLIESALAGNAELEAMLKGEYLKTSSMAAYRLFNPETQIMEYFCRTGGGAYSPCTSMIAAVVEKKLTQAPLSIPEDVGTLVGFLAPKGDRLIFKSLDTTKPMKSKTAGAECGNTSNLGEHHPRVRLLHDAGRADEALAPFILPDADDSWAEGVAKKHMAALKPEHMKDFTHQPLCLYMEFLTRLLDTKKVGGRRWFMSPFESANAGLKTKKR
jgi:hypothetical protein